MRRAWLSSERGSPLEWKRLEIDPDTWVACSEAREQLSTERKETMEREVELGI